MIKNEDLQLDQIPQSADEDVHHFAATFNGYAAAGSFEACAEISQKVMNAIASDETENLTLTELRTVLFFTYRASRHTGEPPEAATVKTLLSLIRARVEVERVE